MFSVIQSEPLQMAWVMEEACFGMAISSPHVAPDYLCGTVLFDFTISANIRFAVGRDYGTCRFKFTTGNFYAL